MRAPFAARECIAFGKLELGTFRALTRHVPGKVLVVDDDPSIIQLLRDALAKEGVTVDGAHDVKSAVALLDTHTFCCLVLDLVLENSSGFDVLRELERRKLLLPAVVVSERLPTYVREMLREDQVKLVFPKPMDTRLIAAVVLGLCGS
jgi:two-component system response regulator ResD